jgi:uncharacterized protein YjbI with pentapeptide repeats
MAFVLASCQPAGATLHGRVTDAVTNSQVIGLSVTVYADSSQTIVASTSTDAQGDFSFDPTTLPAGTYRLRFGASYWWNGASSWSGATGVVLTGTAPVTINPDFVVPAGSMSGTVHASSEAGAPMAGVTVTAISAANSQVVKSTTTAIDGTYSFAWLPAGAYTTQFSKTGYSTRYNDGLDLSVPNGVTITAGQNTVVDSYLAPESTIVGNVYENGTTPVSGIAVVAFEKSNGKAAASTTTGTQGAFSLGTLSGGDYEIGFFDPRGADRTQVYGSETFDLSKGTTVSVGPASAVSIGELLVGQNCDPAVFTDGADLSGHDLTGENLSNCDLTGVNLMGATLTGVNLAGANLTGADLAKANLTGANLSGAVLTSANLTDADLEDATNVTSTIIGSDQSAGLLSATLVGTDFSGTLLNLSGTNMTGKDLSGANLSGANWTDATLTDANLTDANLSGGGSADSIYGLPSATLTGADLSYDGQILTGADLSGGKDLTGTNFTFDNLDYTNFDSATVTDAVFTSTPLYDAKMTNLVGINTTDQVTGVIGDDVDYTDFTGSQVDWSGLVITGKDLVGTNLTGADLSYANLTGVDYRGAILTDANLTGANLSEVDLTNPHDLVGAIVGLPTATLTGTNLSDDGQLLAGLDLSGGKDLTGTNFTDDDLSSTNLDSANLTSANFTTTVLANTDFADATLTGVISSGVTGAPSALPAGWSIVDGVLTDS